MTTLFKIKTVTIFASLFIAGCSSVQISSSNHQKPTIIHAVSSKGVGNEIGTVSFKDSAAGLVITTNLSNLPAGPHGFHIHEKGSCDTAEKDGVNVAALAAGGHYNPLNALNHGNPISGHLGDLPVLLVENNGAANVKLIAPRLKYANVSGLAIMIHAGGDNYSDDPKPLGGGGDRIACGIIP